MRASRAGGRRSRRATGRSSRGPRASENPEKHGFQNTVVRVEDQYGVGVEDFVLELFERDRDRSQRARRAHRAALRSVHAYSDDKSYRSFYIDCTSLFRAIDRAGEFVGLSIAAHPELGPGAGAEGAPVGFIPYGDEGRGGLRIAHRDLADWFAPHRTLLLTLELNRQQAERVFRLPRLSDA